MPVDIYWMMGEAASEGDGLTILSPESFLSAAELERLAGMRFAKRRTEWLAGRRTAKRLLQACEPRLKNIVLRDITIANLPEGAPVVMAGGQVIPGSISLSHRNQRVLAAWTPDAAVSLGADLEWIEPRAPVFVEDYFTQAEAAAVEGFKPAERDQLVTTIWSAKEAALKALGVGLRVDTRQVEVICLPGGQTGQWARLDLSSPLANGSTWYGFWRREGRFILTLAILAQNRLEATPRLTRAA